jgi:two-component system sensor histidine kinase UhpB
MDVVSEFNQSIIDTVADPILVIDTDYHVILMNRAARNFAMEELPPAQPLFCYQLSHHLCTPCSRKGCPCPLEEVRKSGKPVSVTHEHCQANDEKRMIEVHAAPLLDGDGAFIGIIESMHDITERHQTEIALRQSRNRLRALTSQLGELSEIEKKRLSRELHDQVGQSLTALGINLNIIRAEVAAYASKSLLSRLDDSVELVEQTTQRIRDVLTNMRPPVLDDYGLVAALKWYSRRFHQRTNIIMTVEGYELSPRLPSRQENVLFRIAQEALTNVAKHARASQVIVSIEERSGSISMIITDNGIGFNPSQLTNPRGSQGWGLMTMTERAEAEGGKFKIQSQPASGTQVIVEVKR